MRTSTRLQGQDARAVAGDAPALAAHEIEKSFGATRALRGVSVAFEAGAIHALVGENNAGESTLTHILSGALTADAGRILIDGASVVLRTPLDAKALGIRMVH
ncbi:ATP-binding cassette domain-containing protein [Elioraea sp.]|uniref:ATP-binding cassette domain-containing protein n=1 Tax=Elioraea sp. TaxID=2185103 RepID=UPI003F70BA9D